MEPVQKSDVVPFDRIDVGTGRGLHALIQNDLGHSQTPNRRNRSPNLRGVPTPLRESEGEEGGLLGLEGELKVGEAERVLEGGAKELECADLGMTERFLDGGK